MTTPHRPLWQHPQIISTLLLVFVAGGATGALAFRLLREHRIAAAASVPPPPPREPSREAVLQKFKTELDLSPDQTAKIGIVLEDFSHYYESLLEQQTDLRATGKNRIVEILNPEQRDKFEKMMAQLAPQLTPQAAPAK